MLKVDQSIPIWLFVKFLWKFCHPLWEVVFWTKVESINFLGVLSILFFHLSRTSWRFFPLKDFLAAFLKRCQGFYIESSFIFLDWFSLCFNLKNGAHVTMGRKIDICVYSNFWNLMGISFIVSLCVYFGL
jgi:hypothetical protein